MRCTRTLTYRGLPAWRCVWTPSLWTTGAWLAIPPHHQPMSLPIPKLPTPKRQGCVLEDKLLSAVKQLGTMDVTQEEAQYIRLSVRLRDRDAHGYASFFLSKWQHRRQSWEKGSLQIPKCWCAMGSRNRKPSADGNRELPNSANKSPVEKAVEQKRRGCNLQTAGRCTPFHGFPLMPCRGASTRLGKKARVGQEAPTSAATQKSASWH